MKGTLRSLLGALHQFPKHNTVLFFSIPLCVLLPPLFLSHLPLLCGLPRHTHQSSAPPGRKNPWNLLSHATRAEVNVPSTIHVTLLRMPSSKFRFSPNCTVGLI